MEELTRFTGWIIIAFGVLQVILFFKVWIMTNDIREMKNEFIVGDSNQWTLNKAILKGDKSKISDILFNAMFRKIRKHYDDSVSDLDEETKKIFADQILNIKKEYKDKYLKYGINFPESIDKIEKREDIENL